ncbi:potassium channel family protein [Shouchella patagoniensis]|uniref:potassium channel family protein n=1 Tax=Shouchella patagoniensis TaxID=228576 RepID=UPI000994D394|nr:TrkA family potassium uptake protein [Shouchella patagoniensis]
MAQVKQCIVIGLGSFGGSVCTEINRQGHDVMVVDIDEYRLEEYREITAQVVCMDATEERLLKTLGLNQFDFGVVAIGSNIEASILISVSLKELGVPVIWAKAENYHHKKLLERLGIDHVIMPEIDMGVRVVQNMLSESFVDYIALSNEYSIVEYKAGTKMIGKSLAGLNFKMKYRLNLVAIQSKGATNVTPMPDDTIKQGDILIVIGHDRDIKRFQEEGLE